MGTNKELIRLLKRPSFTTKEAKRLGISPSLLAYYAKIGTIERIAYGTYRNPKVESTAPFEWQDLIEIANSIPQGVICGISALSYYGLTQEIQRQYWIAVPNDSKGMRRPKTKIVRMRNMKLGRAIIKVGEYQIHIFDKERSVVDAFRFLSKESAMYSLKAYLRRTDGHKPDLPKLARYAKDLRVDLVPYIEALT